MSINELVSLPDRASRTTTMLDFVNLPGGPLRHAIVNNTHKTHTATIFAISPREKLGFLNLKSGFDSRRVHGDGFTRKRSDENDVRGPGKKTCLAASCSHQPSGKRCWPFAGKNPNCCAITPLALTNSRSLRNVVSRSFGPRSTFLQLSGVIHHQSLAMEGLTLLTK